MCQGRAVAHDRIATGRFDDPTALPMLTDAERVPVEQVRSGVVPKTARERVNFEMVRACGELMAPRTIAIDDAIRDRSPAQIVVLGAGLDGRAWRMKELAAIDVFEVDHPASQGDKRQRVAALAPVARSIQFVPVDFGTDDLDAALETAGHEGSATTWVWEGVVPYLTPAEVEATVRVVRGRSASGSRLIVNYQMPSFRAVIGRLFARGMCSDDSGHAHRPAEPKSAPHRDRRAHPQVPVTAGSAEGHAGGMVLVDVLRVRGYVAVDHPCFGVQRQRHSQGVETRTEICGRGRDSNDHD